MDCSKVSFQMRLNARNAWASARENPLSAGLLAAMGVGSLASTPFLIGVISWFPARYIGGLSAAIGESILEERDVSFLKTNLQGPAEKVQNFFGTVFAKIEEVGLSLKEKVAALKDMSFPKALQVDLVFRGVVQTGLFFLLGGLGSVLATSALSVAYTWQNWSRGENVLEATTQIAASILKNSYGIWSSLGLATFKALNEC